MACYFSSRHAMLASVGTIGYLCAQAGRGSYAVTPSRLQKRRPGAPPHGFPQAGCRPCGDWPSKELRAPASFSLAHCCRRLRAFTASRTCSSTPQSAEPPAASSGEELCAVPCRSAEQLFWVPGRQEVLRHLLRSGVWTINLARPEARLFRGALSLLPALLLGAKAQSAGHRKIPPAQSAAATPLRSQSAALPSASQEKKTPGPCGAPGPLRVPGGRC